MSTSKSHFDNTTEVAVEPGWLKGFGGMLSASNIRLGVYWNTKMGDKAVIIAYYSGSETISGLRFNADGEKTELRPIDASTKFEYRAGEAYSHWSSKRFDTSLSFIEKITKAKTVIVQMGLGREFTEGDFATDAPTMARPGFKKFLAQVGKIKSGK